METIMYIVAGLGGIAGLLFFLKQYIGGKADILKHLHKFKQKQGVEEVNKIVKKQKALRVEIKKGEQVSEDTKKKIKEVQKKAAKEMKEILNEDKAVGEMLDDFNDMSDW